MPFNIEYEEKFCKLKNKKPLFLFFFTLNLSNCGLYYNNYRRKS